MVKIRTSRRPVILDRLDAIRLSVAEARTQLADVLSKVEYRYDRFVITRHGKPVAAIVPVMDLEALEKIEGRSDLKAAKRADADIAKHGTVPLATALKDLRARRR
jgi:prevent-host-death family protein